MLADQPRPRFRALTELSRGPALEAAPELTREKPREIELVLEEQRVQLDGRELRTTLAPTAEPAVRRIVTGLAHAAIVREKIVDRGVSELAGAVVFGESLAAGKESSAAFQVLAGPAAVPVGE